MDIKVEIRFDLASHKWWIDGRSVQYSAPTLEELLPKVKQSVKDQLTSLQASISTAATQLD